MPSAFWFLITEPEYLAISELYLRIKLNMNYRRNVCISECKYLSDLASARDETKPSIYFLDRLYMITFSYRDRQMAELYSKSTEGSTVFYRSTWAGDGRTPKVNTNISVPSQNS